MKRYHLQTINLILWSSPEHVIKTNTIKLIATNTTVVALLTSGTGQPHRDLKR